MIAAVGAIGIAAIAATAVSGVMSAVSAAEQGRAARKQAEFQATVQQQQAAREREIAAAEEESFRRRQSAFLAQRRAALGASGIDISTGTPLLAAGDFASEVELQARRIRAGGETQATRLEQQAALTRSAGRVAERQGRFRAGASLLSGAGRAFAMAR